MFKVSNKDISIRRSRIFIVNCKDVPHLFLVFLFLTLNMHLFAGKAPKNFFVKIMQKVKIIGMSKKLTIYAVAIARYRIQYGKYFTSF